jgi:hypothetical protein
MVGCAEHPRRSDRLDLAWVAKKLDRSRKDVIVRVGKRPGGTHATFRKQGDGNKVGVGGRESLSADTDNFDGPEVGLLIHFDAEDTAVSHLSNEKLGSRQNEGSPARALYPSQSCSNISLAAYDLSGEESECGFIEHRAA